MEYPFSPPNGGELELNRQFAGFLDYSLQIGPHLLNRVHEESDIYFSEDANLVANQDSPLSRYTATGTDREIDWVVSDKDKLVGYESKYGASLTEDQLQDELDKLRVNADGRDVWLIAVTSDITPPQILDRFDNDPVYWISWFTVARRLHQVDESDVPPEQQPILRILRDLFEEENMHPFTGFDHHNKLQYRHFIRDLRHEMEGEVLENPDELHTSITTDPNPLEWERLVPKRLDIPFVHESRDKDWTSTWSYLMVIVDTETHSVHVGIVLNIGSVGRLQDYIDDRLDDLLAYASEQELQLWAAMNSFNQWDVDIKKTTDRGQMRRWLEDGSMNAVRVDGIDYKKAIFVRNCSSSDPNSLVQQTKEYLLSFYDGFLASDDVYPWPTLGDND